MKEEIWKDIPSYEGLYQISSYGRLKALSRKRRHVSRGGVVTYYDYPEKIHERSD